MSGIEGQRFARLRQLFEAASVLGPDGRAAWLDTNCGDDAELRSELEALLTQDARTVMLRLDSAEVERAFATFEDEALPANIAGLRVLERLGAGAMGVVFAAEQEEPRRRVAVKVMRMLLGANMRERFQREVDLLARLDHPNIAHVFFVGRTEQGQPFLAMELVEGPTLAEWSRSGPDLGRRLALLGKLCRAIEHAHQRGVMHRDLKPSNILVAEGDEPKVIDFGVARLLRTSVDVAGLTAERDLVGTLPYMSPEQFTGSALDVDARVDIYALGVIAYELFAGRLPYEFAGKSITEVAHMLDREVPMPLGRCSALLRGDLEAIVQKAMAHDREERYPAASSLLEDLERHRLGQPIGAVPPTTWYVARKFLRRHRAAAASAAFGILALVAGLAVALVALDEAHAAAEHASQKGQEALEAGQRAERSRDEAQASAAAALDLVGRLQWVLEVPAATNLIPDARFADVLVLAAAELDRELQAEPVVEARLRTGLARAFLHVGMTDEAATQLARLEPIAGVLETDWDERQKYEVVKLQLCLAKGDLAAARPLVDRLVALGVEAQGPDSRVAIQARGMLLAGFAAAGAHDEVRVLAGELRADAAKISTELASYAAEAQAGLALAEVALARGEMREAQAFYNRLTTTELATYVAGRADLARRRDELQRKITGAAARAVEARPEASWRSIYEVGRVLHSIDDDVRAEPLLRRAFEALAAVDPPSGHDLGVVGGTWSVVLSRLGRHTEAVGPLELALAASLPHETNTLVLRVNLAGALQRAGRHQEALDASIELPSQLRDPRHTALVFGVLRTQGKALTGLQRYAEAEVVLLRAVAIAKERGFPPKEVPELVALYSAWGKPDEAAKWNGGR